MRKRGAYKLSRRRRAVAIRARLAFAVARSPLGDIESLTVFAGRRSLTRALSPGEVAMLRAALSPASQ